jgi:hypothetical protein
MSASRRLAAILAVDVVGYSSYPMSRNLGGRIVKTAGDGVLLEFPIVAAVECAAGPSFNNRCDRAHKRECEMI